ncbi:MAG: response regulator [Candidatus Anammoxibacter sp.]
MNKRILVIDDDEAVQDSFQLAIKSDGNFCESAFTGEEGIVKASGNNKPDLIFSDLRMPGIDGIETLRQLHKVCPDTPRYVVTAFHREYMKSLKTLVEGGVDFEICNKPLNHNQIRRIVNSVFRESNFKETKLSLKLYIAGNTSGAIKTIDNVKRIFGKEVICKYELKVIDVINEPFFAKEDNIIATPTLASVNPDGVRMVIGDISDTEAVLNGLGIPLTMMRKRW